MAFLYCCTTHSIVCIGLKKAQTLEYGKRNDVYKGMLIFTVGLLIFCLSKPWKGSKRDFFVKIVYKIKIWSW